DDVHFADVNAIGKVHVNEADHLAEARPNFVAGFDRLEMNSELAFTNAGDAAAGIDTAFRRGEGMAADIGGENFDVPGVGKGNGVGYGDGDRIGLFAGGTARAPDAERAGGLPELFDVQFGQDAFFKTFKDTGIAEERSFLREQGFQQCLKLKIGFANGAKQVGAAGMALACHVLAHTSGEESLARFVEPDACAPLNKHADLAKYVFSQTHWAALA